MHQKTMQNHVGASIARPHYKDLLKNKKGITLVALIITVIVMMILVGVSVNVALGNGLFSSAQGAAKDMEGAKKNEIGISNGQINVDGTNTTISEYVDSLVNGNTELVYFTVLWGEMSVELCAPAGSTLRDVVSLYPGPIGLSMAAGDCYGLDPENCGRGDYLEIIIEEVHLISYGCVVDSETGLHDSLLKRDPNRVWVTSNYTPESVVEEGAVYSFLTGDVNPGGREHPIL